MACVECGHNGVMCVGDLYHLSFPSFKLACRSLFYLLGSCDSRGLEALFFLLRLSLGFILVVRARASPHAGLVSVIPTSPFDLYSLFVGLAMLVDT